MCPEQSGSLGPSSPSTTSLDSSQNESLSMIRVLLVDDHTMLRQGLRSVIDGSSRMVVVAEAGNGVEAIEAVHHSKPDVVVMDVNMPRMNGVEATKRIKEEFPEVPIIGLSVQTGMDIVQQMQAAGVYSYLTKESAVETLCRTIEDAAAHKE